MKPLLILSDENFTLNPARLHHIAEQATAYEVFYQSASSVGGPLWAGAEMIWGAPSPEALSQAESLRWLHLTHPYAEAYVGHEIFRLQNILLTKPRGVFGPPAAEHALTLMLMLLRNLPIRHDPDSVPPVFEEPRELSYATVAVLGLGEVGQTLCKLLNGFSCRVIGVRKNFLGKVPYVQKVYDLFDLPTVLSQAHFVFSTLPLTRETQNILHHEAFSYLPMGSLFVHVGSDGVVLPDTLEQALHRRILAGAALDLTRPGQLDPDHPLWSRDNVVITTCASGLSDQIHERRYTQFLELLTRFTAARPLPGRVDFFAGY